MTILVFIVGFVSGILLIGWALQEKMKTHDLINCEWVEIECVCDIDEELGTKTVDKNCRKHGHMYEEWERSRAHRRAV